MRLQFSLRLRIFVVLGLLMAVTVGGGGFMLWYGVRLQGFLADIFDRQVLALEAAMRLESSLAAQRGYLTYYSLDHDKKWIAKLSEQQNAFEHDLNRVRALSGGERSRQQLDVIAQSFMRLTMERERVVELLDAGDRPAASVVHVAARARFDSLMGLCDAFMESLHEALASDRDDGVNLLKLVNALGMASVIFTFLLGFGLAVVLSRQILAPIRRMAQDHDEPVGPDEVAALENRVHGLIERVGQAKAKLEKSQAHLQAAERMATVGRMAAGVAHSIRNPLTSVKMRLFSLNRSLTLTAVEKEDFEVISDEIKHLDGIIQNFLEFARPPKLKLRRVSPSEVVDQAALLLDHRLRGQGVNLVVEREELLRPILIDPEQIKELLVNLFTNAMDAMEGRGVLVVTEEEGFLDAMGRVAVVSVSDSGPGVAEEHRDEVFEPFFTTKEDGTGLGLPIARRIATEHGGTLALSQSKVGGAKFTLTLPFDAEVQGGARWR
ncbi:hypothetical protein JCM15519_13160 [Fundidesulfovibrio butyratiphilus]